MSNQAVGSVYQRIIQEVIQNSTVDFEEAGVDSATLTELQTVWQKKLSSLNVAQFPWDPAPAPPVINNPTPVPSNAPRHVPGPGSIPPSQSSTTASAQNGGPRIKQEQGYEPTVLSNLQAAAHNGPGGGNANVAAMRASGLLQQKYGSQASNQINALQGKAAAGLMLPGSRPAMQYPGQGQNQQTQQQQQQRSTLGGSQADGTGDANDQWTAVMLQRNAKGETEELGTVEIDRLIWRGVEKMGKAMEGGGLMLPLTEVRPSMNGKKRRRAPAQTCTSMTIPVLPSSVVPPVSSPTAPRSTGFDGADDDSDDEMKKPDVADEDAINSDLDDPEDNPDDENDDDESLNQTMLCTYDKVQRVKNKWKCVLKDGVLTINGKEYVFHKATGDYEWY